VYQGRTEEYSLTIKRTGRSFKDYKFDVINYYQKQLENELVSNLKQKYSVDINLKEFFKIIEETKKEQ
jgi:2-hydroxy-3-keto-5-methylthiopentenyl-1-phosphate phosphatase